MLPKPDQPKGIPQVQPGTQYQPRSDVQQMMLMYHQCGEADDTEPERQQAPPETEPRAASTRVL